ncbi:hypothetical protein [Kineobactrum salinum]|uniref:Uncharacterized protein n=1 Tax=Kineobactrum salinum TaxID=2708301 RepID=A0A6C0U957_9GAMM|nr:hypothetical protein [Kineobactrum salinum]QIB67135.1 hypothetical protein G3T16_18755 [Kineobactrum salinum]
MQCHRLRYINEETNTQIDEYYANQKHALREHSHLQKEGFTMIGVTPVEIPTGKHELIEWLNRQNNVETTA